MRQLPVIQKIKIKIGRYELRASDALSNASIRSTLVFEDDMFSLVNEEESTKLNIFTTKKII